MGSPLVTTYRPPGAHPGTTHRHPISAMSPICLAATLLAIVLFPLILLAWSTESRPQRARRWRSYGWSQQRIANRLGCSRTTVRRLLAA